MKYIKTSNLETGEQEIFLFNKNIDHDCMMESLSRIKNTTDVNWKRIRREPVSAGFVDSKFNCYGESVTLKLKSSQNDTPLLKKQLGIK